MGSHGSVTVRPERPADREAIRGVNIEAFGRNDEADLVDALRRSGRLSISLLAIENDRAVGHIAFSPVTIGDGSGSLTCLGLAPMAVVPAFQGRGTGSRLIASGLRQCRARGADLVFVLGYPGYYSRFGFTPALANGLRWEHEAPPGAFMVLELTAGTLEAAGGVVRFAREFDAFC